MTTLRVCFIGDSHTLGTGDEEFLGWPGRVMHRERAAGHDVTMYNLGIRGDTTTMIEPRWRAEAEARLPAENPGALVFSFGCNDMAMQEGVLRNSPEEAVASATRMITEAKAWLPTLWLGPLPVNDDDMPFSSAPGRDRYLSSSRNAQLSDKFQHVAEQLGVPFLDLFTLTASDPSWMDHYAQGDGVHTKSGGYAAIAEHVIGWDAWRRWFDE